MDFLKNWETIPVATQRFITQTLNDAGIDVRLLLRSSSNDEKEEIIDGGKKLLTIREVMELTRYSRSTIIRKIKDGSLKVRPKTKAKEKILIFASSVIEWLQGQKQKTICT